MFKLGELKVILELIKRSNINVSEIDAVKSIIEKLNSEIDKIYRNMSEEDKTSNTKKSIKNTKK